MLNKMNEKQFICIICPLGCAVTVKSDDSGNITEVIGNECKKGDPYARDEFTRPMRVLTSTVAVEGAIFSRLPVRTTGPIPKDRMIDYMKELNKLKVKAPVMLGDIITHDVLGLGVDIIATRSIGR